MDNSNNKKQQLQQIPPQPQFQQAPPQQPQFQQAPQQPQQFQQMPPQPMAGAPYQMPPKKNMSKGVFWGIIGGVVAIIAIVGIVLAFVFLGGSGDKKGGAQVSKEDYKDFYSQINKLDISRDVEGSKYASLSYRGIERTLGEIDEK